MPLFRKIALVCSAVFWWLRDLWHVIRHLWVVLLLLAVGTFALTGVDQARDLFVSFVESSAFAVGARLMKANEGYYLKFWFFVVLWSFTTWFSARTYLKLVDVRADNPARVANFIQWLPRLLGALPYAVTVLAFRSAGDGWGSLHVLMGLFTGVVYLAYVTWRRKIFRHIPPLPRQQLRWSDLSPNTRQTVWGLLIGLAVVFWALVLSPRAWGLAEWLRPAGIVVGALCTWTLVGVLIQYVGYRSRFPVFGLLVGLVVVSSRCNDNHALRTSNDRPLSRLTDSAYVAGWLRARVAELSPDSVTTYPVYLVATEGGGIRSAYWTASVLARLDSLNPHFYRHTLAVSGVSGGSLGAVLFHALYRDFRLDSTHQRVSLLTKARQILGEDHLSGVTSALLYPDLVQRFLPFPIPSWDRARWLEDSWSFAYRKHTRSPAYPAGLATLDSSFATLWLSDKNYQLPCLFLNATVVETGQKAVTTNVQLSPGHFVDIIDVVGVRGETPLLKTAASISARFPYVTPPATVRTGSSDTLWGHLVDGGYFENTGLSTAVEVLNLLSSGLDSAYQGIELPASLRRKIRPVILYIRNNNYEPDPQPPLRWMYETLTPPTALLNAWDRGSVTTSNDVRRVVTQLRPPAEFTTFDLNRRGRVMLPLGWFLSETARREINGQLDTLRNSHLPR